MPVSVKVGGTWRAATNVFTKVSGTWRTATDMPVKVGGVWKTGVLIQGAYESIATINISSPTSAAVSFTSIPQTYKHLQVRAIVRCNDGGGTGPSVMFIRANGDINANYSYHSVQGNGGSFNLGRQANANQVFGGAASSSASSANIFGGMILDVFDYTSTSKFKTMKQMSGSDHNATNPNGAIQFGSGVWMSTSAINSLSFQIVGGISFAAGTSFALYGIKG